MESKINQAILIISFLSLIFFNPAQGICVPCDSTHQNPSPPSHSPHNPHPGLTSTIPLGSSSSTKFITSTNRRGFAPSSSFTSTLTEDDPILQIHPNKAFGDKLFHHSIHPISVPPVIATIHRAAIQKICDKTDNPSLCISSISPFLKGAGAKIDVHSVIEMAIKACSHHAKLAILAASKLARGSSDATTVSSINDCKDFYSDALDNLQSARDAIASRDIGTINIMLSAAVTDFGTCEDGFAGESSPLAHFNEKLSKLASNCLAIASLI
ncbi:hypothetical protein L1049_017252 [Liquidambar formosana]|uniref:Pectinesterase inhibitor domain-containing protein n=1 Tax=Liquidambar formosana TaxID=63359 RepID=A0AAP0X7A5_LIQFO